jgi:hypothetical protein
MQTLNPMSTFDPSKRCFLYDATNGWAMEWHPEYAGDYRRWAEPWSDDARFMHFDGLLLGGWTDRAFVPAKIAKIPA